MAPQAEPEIAPEYCQGVRTNKNEFTEFSNKNHKILGGGSGVGGTNVK